MSEKAVVLDRYRRVANVIELDTGADEEKAWQPPKGHTVEIVERHMRIDIGGKLAKDGTYTPPKRNGS